MKIKFSWPKEFVPKIYSLLAKGYSKETFFSDLSAGVIVGIVALPLAIAFAIASGVKPEQGLYAAIVAGLFVSLLSGSRSQVSGPTGAFIVIIYGIVQLYGYDGLAVATLLAGIFLVVLGLLKFGILLRFIPYSLTIGFTTGIAIIIFTSQINDFLGLGIAKVPADFVDKWIVFSENIQKINYYALGIGAISLLFIFVWGRYNFKIPGSLIAIIVGTLAVYYFNLPVDTIGSKFGAVPNSLPEPRLPQISWQVFTQMFSPAFTIAMLAAIESLLSAVVADGMMGSRHRSNMELVSQGVGNIISPIFFGIPVTGAIARTATNIKSGAKTPVAGVIHGIVILVTMLLFADLASLIPLPVLAAILIYVAWNMSEMHAFFRTLKGTGADKLILLNTFLLTLFIDLTVAIEVGLVLAALTFIKKMSDVTQTQLITQSLYLPDEGEDKMTKPSLPVPKGVEIFEVYGTLFFGAVDQFRDTIRGMNKKPEVLVLEVSKLLVIDGSGLKAIEDLVDVLKKDGTSLVISGIHKQPLFELTRSGIIDKIGEDNLFGSLDETLKYLTDKTVMT
ncbi:MAG: STAS domain-containing protein [Ignavibacteria bacterium]|nr:STAS domain-containing protein [Ignavibacteria bacterium]